MFKAASSSNLVILPNGKTLLIDGGPRIGGENLINVIQEQNITKIDTIVATHAHTDHIGGSYRCDLTHSRWEKF